MVDSTQFLAARRTKLRDTGAVRAWFLCAILVQCAHGSPLSKVARDWCSARMAPLFFAFLAGQCVVLCRIEEIRIGCYSTEKQKVW